MSEPVRYVDEDQMVPLHPLAERLDPGGIDQAGQCICGGVLAPQREWHDFGRDWQHVRCPLCRTLYVDEGEYLTIWEDDESKSEPCCHREESAPDTEGEGQ